MYQFVPQGDLLEKICRASKQIGEGIKDFYIYSMKEFNFTTVSALKKSNIYIYIYIYKMNKCG